MIIIITVILYNGNGYAKGQQQQQLRRQPLVAVAEGEQLAGRGAERGSLSISLKFGFVV